MQKLTGIQRAVEMKGSPGKLAEAVGNGVLRQHVEHWLDVGRVSVKRAPEVAEATGIALEDLNDEMDWGAVERVLTAVKRPEPSKEGA